jgi:hypothetical protein
VNEPSAPGSHGDWDTVAEVGQVFEAELMALRLRGEGIDALVVDQSYRQEPVPSVRALSLVRVLVPAARAGEARQLLAEPVDLPEDFENTEAGQRPSED